jgi:hypothetical protein
MNNGPDSRRSYLLVFKVQIRTDSHLATRGSYMNTK